jgi:hypothetical protein
MEELGIPMKNRLPPIISQRRLVMRQPALIVGSIKELNISDNIKSLLFVNQGESKVNICLPKDSYYPDEMVSVRCIIDNSKCA